MSDQSTNAKDGFANTNWSALNGAARGEAHAEIARDEICLNYRQPLYCYIRRKGYSPEDAEDLIQGFLFQFIFGTDFASLDPAKGPFRAYLLACLNNFLANAHRDQKAQKRGGDTVTFSLDVQQEEAQYLAESWHNETPEVLFDRQWAATVLERAWAKMQAEFDRVDKAALFQELKFFVDDQGGQISQTAAAERLRMTPEAFRKALQRFRAQYHQEVRATVASDELAQQETRFIQKTLKF